MKFEFHHQAHALHLVLSGRFDSLLIEPDHWEPLRSEVASKAQSGAELAIYLDFRLVAYIDTRAIHELLEHVAPLRACGALNFIGPGPGLDRLTRLDEAPFLSPMEEFAPWEGSSSAGEWSISFGVDPEADTEEGLEGLTDAEILAALEERLGSGGEPAPGPVRESPSQSKREGDTRSSPGATAYQSAPSFVDIELSEPESFEIDLDLERTYLDSPSDDRDYHDIPESGLEFSEGWRPLPAEQPIESRRDGGAISYLAHEAQKQSSKRPPERPLANFEDPILEASRPAAPDEPRTGQERLRAKAKRIREEDRPAPRAPREVKSPATEAGEPSSPGLSPGRTSGAESNPELLGGVGELLTLIAQRNAELERVRAEASQLEETVDSIRAKYEDERQRRLAVEAELAQASTATVSSPSSALSLCRPLMSLEAFPEYRSLARLERAWRALLRSIFNREELDFEAFARLVEEASPGEWCRALALSELTRPTPNPSPFELSWSSLAFALSILGVELEPGAEFTRRWRDVVLAALVDTSNEEPPLFEKLEQSVADLRELPGYDCGEDRALERSDLELWRAASHLTRSKPDGVAGWRPHVERHYRKLGAEPVLKAGLARCVRAHGLYLVGSWVELATGELGVVVRNEPDRPEFPQVLLQFRREASRSVAMAPRLFPASNEDYTSIIRVLAEPRLVDGHLAKKK